MRIVSLLVSVFLAAFAFVSAARAGDPVTTESLLKELADPFAIARYPDPPFRLLQSSSYDRATKTPDDAKGWFANDDCGKFIRVDERGSRKESVMLDAEGPGAVVRIWSPNPKGVMRVYLDGSDKPVIEAPMNELLDGTTLFGDAKKGFPLAASLSRGWSLFVPISFSRRCVVTTDDGAGVYYQINWRQYQPTTKVVSLASLKDLPHATDDSAIRDRSRIAGPKAGAEVRTVKAGETVEVSKRQGGGVLTQLGVFAGAASVRCDRLVLAIEADGEETVWGPVTEVMLPANTVQSQPATAKLLDVDRALSWPMPFRDTMRITLTNLGTSDVSCAVDAAYAPWTWDERSMHFHAAWRRDAKLHTRPMRDFRFVTVEGQGVFVGDSLHIVNPVDAWWGEGDEKIYVDGEIFPSHIGTGTEDYYGYGWCCPEPFVHPLHSQTVCDGYAFGTNWGRTIVSRLRGLDTIPFEKSFRFDMEVWHWAECDVAYAPTTYWYAKPGATSDARPDLTEAKRGRVDPLPIFMMPGAIECEAMKISAKSEGLPTSVQGLRSFVADGFSAERHLWVQGRRVGDFVELSIPVTETVPVNITLHATKSWDYGIVQCAVNGVDVGKPIDLYSGEKGKVLPSGPIDLGVHAPKDGEIRLRVTVVGGNEHAEGTRSFFGLDAVVVGSRPKR